LENFQNPVANPTTIEIGSRKICELPFLLSTHHCCFHEKSFVVFIVWETNDKENP
jgi:hypothetical protein